MKWWFRQDGHQATIYLGLETRHCILTTLGLLWVFKVYIQSNPREKPKRMGNFTKEKLDILLDVLLICLAKCRSIITTEQTLSALKGSRDKILVKRLGSCYKVAQTLLLVLCPHPVPGALCSVCSLFLSP